MGRVKDYYWDEICSYNSEEPDYYPEFYTEELEAYQQYEEIVTDEQVQREDYWGHCLPFLQG
jgi:hypothetical protein